MADPNGLIARLHGGGRQGCRPDRRHPYDARGVALVSGGVLSDAGAGGPLLVRKRAIHVREHPGVVAPAAVPDARDVPAVLGPLHAGDAPVHRSGTPRVASGSGAAVRRQPGEYRRQRTAAAGLGHATGGSRAPGAAGAVQSPRQRGNTGDMVEYRNGEHDQLDARHQRQSVTQS